MLADYETAPISEPLRETLRFLEAMTLRPDEVDPSAARAAGVSTEALRDAVYVSAAFNLVDRFADAIGAETHSARGLTRAEAIAHEGRFFEEGYA